MEVPGGANANNYANVRLIVQVAERAGVDAVWPGWYFVWMFKICLGQSQIPDWIYRASCRARRRRRFVARLASKAIL